MLLVTGHENWMGMPIQAHLWLCQSSNACALKHPLCIIMYMKLSTHNCQFDVALLYIDQVTLKWPGMSCSKSKRTHFLFHIMCAGIYNNIG